MINGEVKADSSQRDNQRKLLEVRFSDAWNPKQESKVEISGLQALSDTELNAQLERLLNGPALKKAIPNLKLVSNSDAKDTDD